MTLKGTVLGVSRAGGLLRVRLDDGRAVLCDYFAGNGFLEGDRVDVDDLSTDDITLLVAWKECIHAARRE